MANFKPPSFVKILVCGDVDGKFKKVFGKVAAINKKNGPFEALLCVGNFFGDDNAEWFLVKSGKIHVPVTTYILGPCKPEHEKYFPDINGFELSSNITYLGKKGILTGSTGLKIAYLSGIEGTGHAPHIFNAKDVVDLQDNFRAGVLNGVDILLTSQWPRGVTKYAGIPENLDPCGISGSELISYLAVTVKPRYHFAGLEGIYYERLPYRNHQVLLETACHSTRFTSLAKAENAGKAKVFYAFTISPLSSMSHTDIIKQVGHVTECPYQLSYLSQAVKSSSQPGSSSQYFFDLNSLPEGLKRKARGKGDNQGDSNHDKKPRLQNDCWFCLSSPAVQKHLIISIADNCYVALAKGGLIPGHLLIIPTKHVKSTVELSDVVISEITKFKTAIKKYFASKDKQVVFFERNYNSPHGHIQAVPVPRDIIPNVKDILIACSASQNLSLTELPLYTDIKQVVQPNIPYFWFELECRINENHSRKLFHMIKNEFPLQFGRELLANKLILNIPHRVDWKNCQVTKEKEIQMTKEFRKEYTPFDFTLSK